MHKRKNIKIFLYQSLMIALLLGFGKLYGSDIDWLGQHVAFPDVFRQNFYETKQLIPEFLFNIGGGQNIYNFVYYGFLSPFFLLSYFLPFVDMTTYIMVVSVVCYLVSGQLFYFFFKRHFEERLSFWTTIIFSTLAPLTFHFHHHIMFVWYIPFFILALLGLERLFDKKKSGLFIISTFFIIMTNYYYSVGCLVFLFVYAIYLLLKKDKWSWKEFFRTVYLFAIPVLLSAVIILPTAYTLFGSGRSMGHVETLQNLIIPSLMEYFYSTYSMGISAVVLFAIVGNFTSKTRNRADMFLNGFTLFLLVCPLFTYVLNGMLYVRGKVLIAYAILALYNFCQFIEKLHKKEINFKLTTIITSIYIVFCAIFGSSTWLFGLVMMIELAIALKWKHTKWCGLYAHWYLHLLLPLE